MNRLFLSAALVSMVGLLPACAVSAEDPGEETASESAPSDQPAPEKTGATREAVVAPPAEQVCCSNISGYGSVMYYQSWGGYGWITTTTSYHQGGGCPGSSGACSRVDPVQ